MAVSAAVAETAIAGPEAFRAWWAATRARRTATTTRVPLEDLAGWHTDPDTGDLRHDSGRFFSVEGLRVSAPGAPVPAWDQPIINQPEVGILGILVREVDGVLHLLLQAKIEPGNCNGLQLSPTVQATRSNYTGAHRGRAVPYVEYFRDAARHRVLADVRQSEQGAWFHRKRNRNMIVEVDGDVPVEEDFHWFTLRQVHELLAVDDLVNMDARTVLSCLPMTGAPVLSEAGPDAFGAALRASFAPHARTHHDTAELLSWITEHRTRTEVSSRLVPLRSLRGWRREDGRIAHESGRFFEVVGVDVRAGHREVGGWSQPMIAPHGTGVVGFLVREIRGVLHVLVHARAEPGYLDVVELAPTAQGTPENYVGDTAVARPRHLDALLGADPAAVRFDTVLSEEGGRFDHARTRHLVVEADRDVLADQSAQEAAGLPTHRWMTVHQIGELLRHSHYLNVQARSLVACLHSLRTSTTDPDRSRSNAEGDAR